MKKMSNFLMFVIAILALAVSACGPAVAQEAGGNGKGQASLVEFTGVIESIDGDQWVVGGQTITVDPAVLGDAIFGVGDSVKIELETRDDGSLVVIHVESSNDNQNTNDDAGNVNGNTNDANINDSNANDANVNDGNSNDDDSNDDNSNGINGGVGNSNSNSNSNINDDSNDDHDSLGNTNINGDDSSDDQHDDSGNANSNGDDSHEDDHEDNSNSSNSNSSGG